MHAMLNVAVMAARRGGDTLIRNMNKLEKLNVEQKGRNDFVSDADLAAEKAVIETILKHHPDHAILAEESGQRGESGCEWIIDPLDGTRNYLSGYPHFCVSIGIKERDRLEHGVVYDPIRQEMFTASRGAGAAVNNRRIRVSATSSFETAILGTGLPQRSESKRPTHQASIAALTAEACAVRHSGSAALDLAYVASGRLDAFWEYGLMEWDIAAGVLLVREAGGMVSAIDGGEKYMQTGDILASNPKLFRSTLRLLNRPTGGA